MHQLQLLLSAIVTFAALQFGWAASSLPDGCTGKSAVYKFDFHDFKVTVLSDGDLEIKRSPFLISPSAVERSYRNLSLSTDPFLFPQNVVALQRDSDTLLIDTGTGTFTGLGLRAGHLVGNLLSAGIDPESVTGVLFTHGHVDHVGGLTDKSGKPVFPNAKLYISKTEYDFWENHADALPSSPTRIYTSMRAQLAGQFAKMFEPYKGKILYVEDGASPVPGVKFRSTPGHSPDHMSIMVEGNGNSLVIVGDAFLNKANNIQNPEWVMNIETNGTEAVATRLSFMDNLAGNKFPVIVYHEAFPGLGYIKRAGPWFDFVPHPDTEHIVRKCNPRATNA